MNHINKYRIGKSIWQALAACLISTTTFRTKKRTFSALIDAKELSKKKHKNKVAWLALLVSLVSASPISSAGEFWGVVNLASKHIGEEKPLNERNPGLGIEYAQSQEFTYMAGAYRNSHNRKSLYAFAAYTPVQYDGFSFGVAAGAASGYTSGRETKTLPVFAGIVRWRGENFGVNMLTIPKSKNATATLGLQAVFKF